MLDAVLELQAAGHDVQLYTAHHDPRRCFAETLQGMSATAAARREKALLNACFGDGTDGVRAPWVHVHGGWLPRSVLGRLHAVLAYARCILAAIALLLSPKPFHVVVLDQVSAPIPLLRAASRAKARRLSLSARQCEARRA